MTRDAISMLNLPRDPTLRIVPRCGGARGYPVEPELADVLRWHRRELLANQAPGLSEGYMFPSSTGTLRVPSSVIKAWQACLETAEIDKRFTLHGLRYTFTDLVRRANVDAVVRRALTGHVTEEMQRHYSTVSMDEKRAAVAGVLRLVHGEKVGTEVGTGPETKEERQSAPAQVTVFN